MIAVITGAGSGIGYEMSRILLMDYGYDLILTGRNIDRLEDARQKLTLLWAEGKKDVPEGRFPSILTYALDVSDRRQVMNLHQKLQEKECLPDLVIHAAGFGTIGEFLSNDWEKEEQETLTNCNGVLHMMHAFLPDMVERNHGYFLNVASSASYMPGSPNMAVYYASKSYVLRLTEGVYQEIHKRADQVYLGCLCPGPVLTDFSRKALGNEQDANHGTEGPGDAKPVGEKPSVFSPTLTAEVCARKAIVSMFRRKRRIVHRFWMKFTIPAAKLLPDSFLLHLASRHQSKKLK